jgi:hypothetical protein
MRPGVFLKRSLIFIHRWVGVALSLLFMLWFCSGVVMMYWSYPDVTRQDRLERAPVLTPGQIRLSPEDAWSALRREDQPGEAVLSTFDGRPVYRFGGGTGGGPSGGQSIVYADDGTPQKKINDAIIDRAAAAWAKQPLSSAKKESVEEVDQWTVGGQFRTLRPLYKYSFTDGQQVYVSGRDAEVVQYTTSDSRLWAYLGAIPHWLYFTPLRRNQPAWFRVVVWTSGIGTVTAILGIVIAIWMLSPSRKYRNAGMPTSIPYKGWKRWHAIIGLTFGIVTATWALSGLLSMGPFEFVERLAGRRSDATRRTNGAVNIAGALRGAGRFNLASYAAKRPTAAISSLGDGFQVKELEFTMFAGEAVYIATDSKGATRIVPVNGEPMTEFASDKVMDVVRQAAGANLSEVRLIHEYDAYYLDRTGQRPLPVVYARMADKDQTRYYIDVKTAAMAGTYNSRNWVSRWLYHGLHSLDFPWLYKHRPLWDIVVILLMAGGTGVCVTSLVLAWRVIRRKLAVLLPTGAISTLAKNEDLSQVPGQ